MNRAWRLALLVLALSASVRSLSGQEQPPGRLREDVGSEPYREAIRRFNDKELPKVIGGTPAPPGAFPWQVSLTVASIPDPVRAHFCGASIYSDRWIVTAAHCVRSNAPEDITVVAGTQTLAASVERRAVRRILVNPQFDVFSKDHDVAVVELEQPLALGDRMQAIRLATAGEEASVIAGKVRLAVVGWGMTKEGGVIVRDLRFVRIPMVDRTICNKPFAHDGQVTLNMLCAGERLGAVKDSCRGDSGGPLSASLAGTTVLLGITSWTAEEGCGLPNKVGVYARASVLRDWVATCIADSDACALPGSTAENQGTPH